MYELVKVREIEIAGRNEKGVDARELHEFLEVGSRFNLWIERRINETGFVENQDYVVLLKSEYKPLGGRPEKDYILSLDSAKHFAMLEKSAKGREIRQYFIDCEKQLRVVAPQDNLVAQIKMMLAVAERQEALKLQVDHTQKLAERALEATKTNLDYVSVIGYARLNKITLRPGQASKIGIRLSKLAKMDDVELPKINDARYGGVNVYPHDFLRDNHFVFKDYSY